MALTAASTGVAQEVTGTGEPTRPGGRAAAIGQERCPRCGTRLVVTYDEPECPGCGYVDYSHAPAPMGKRSNSLLSAATRYVLRYVGDFPNLAETLTEVELRMVRRRDIYAVDCPFCEQPMYPMSQSGSRPNPLEQRYKCEHGHRVSLVTSPDGALGWA